MKFLKPLFLVLLTLTLASCSGKLPEAKMSPSSTQTITHTRNSTAALVMKSAKGIRVYCSAIFVADEITILTAAHCVEGAADYLDRENVIGTPINYTVEKEVNDVDEDPNAIYSAHVVAVDHDHDLALIRIDTNVSHEIAKIAQTSPVIGERVLAVGHLSGLYYSFMYGTISQVRKDMGAGFGKLFQINCSSYFGSSGGGAFNENGELIGVASFLLPKTPSFVFYIHLDSIKEFVKNNNK